MFEILGFRVRGGNCVFWSFDRVAELGLSPQLCVWCGELIGFLLALQDMGRLQLARAVLGAQRSWGSRSQPGLHRFYSSAATKASEPASSPSSSAQESPSASASEHAGGNVAEANVRSRTWDEHRLTADQLQFRSLASVGNQPSRRLCFCSPPGWITNFSNGVESRSLSHIC